MSLHVEERCSRGCGRGATWYYNEQWVCDPCYQAEEFAPGHVLDGDRRHFLGTGCNDCGARTVSAVTLEQAERWYHQGLIGQDLWEAYCHVWATSAYRYGSYESWRKSPVIPEVVRLVAVMRGILTLRLTAPKTRAL